MHLIITECQRRFAFFCFVEFIATTWSLSLTLFLCVCVILCFALTHSMHDRKGQKLNQNGTRNDALNFRIVSKQAI